LAYIGKGDGTARISGKNITVHIKIGFTIILWSTKYHYFKAIGALYFVCCFSVYIIHKGTVIAGANASRWIQIPFIGKLLFSPSVLLHGVVYICSSFLSKKRTELLTFKVQVSHGCLRFITLIFILPVLSVQQSFIYGVDASFYSRQHPLKGIVIGSEL
jgi:cell division protein FtsW